MAQYANCLLYTSVFNRCENSDDILMAVENWKDAHPLLKIIPVEWKYTIPYGILYSPEPSDLVKRFLKGVKKALSQPDACLLYTSRCV